MNSLQGADRFPDIVFTANAAVIRKRTAYLANFYYPERQGERLFYEKWFRENGYETVGNRDIPFEGMQSSIVQLHLYKHRYFAHLTQVVLCNLQFRGFLWHPTLMATAKLLKKMER